MNSRPTVIAIALLCVFNAQLSAQGIDEQVSTAATSIQSEVSLHTSTSVEDPQKALLHIQQRWAKVNYQLTDSEQDAAFKDLLEEVSVLTKAYPQNAELVIWKGIIQSSYAGAKGGLGALSLAKEAKQSLEQAIAIDPEALSGSAYTSLGTLYHKVPGWPLGFGNDKTAKSMLEKALEINPQGIDPNYFYGEFLYDEHQYAKAKDVLQTALNAPKRDGRALADEARRAEVHALMQKVDAKLKAKG
jgi:tetratricopeptide (TPR) repeat protein